MSQSTTAEPAINTKLIVPFITAVREVFKKMANVDVTVKAPHVKTHPGASYDVCGVIGFSGTIVGSAVVSFSNTAAENLVAAFTGMPVDPTSLDFSDAIGELANMIAGGAKQRMRGVASISLPNVVIGKGYTLASMSDSNCLVIPCTSACGDFAIEVCIKELSTT